MTNSNNQNEFYQKLLKKMIEENFISTSDDIQIEIIYTTKQKDEFIHHYLVTDRSKTQKILIKTLKEKDYSYTVMNYLMDINKNCKDVEFPSVLGKPFVIDQRTYIPTSFLDGMDLNKAISTKSKNELLFISSELDRKLKLLHKVTNNFYSEGYQIRGLSYADIMFNKLYNQFCIEKYTSYFTKNRDIKKLLLVAKNILSNAAYSKPTLIHLDIKPHNIIISSNEKVYLVDFELARFGDIDYEWANLLIKTLHAYDKRFKKYVLQPIIENNFLPLEQAIKNDKYKIYMLYLSMNIYIYYLKCGKWCPLDIIKLINMLLDELINFT